MSVYEIRVNGRLRQVEASDPRMPLLWVLRDRLRLTGTKYGCGVGICGACTVLDRGRAVRACQVPVSDAVRGSYTTIEGLSRNGAASPCQRAWIEEDVAQCGYCQPGMILETVALLERSPRPDDREIEEALGSHVCRCGTFARIRRAVRRAGVLALGVSK
jgi:isoquinoline 1-oxidoreductase subunit alpha